MTLLHHTVSGKYHDLGLELNRRARAYMVGASVMNRKDLITARDQAKADTQLTGQLRKLVIKQYNDLIASADQ